MVCSPTSTRAARGRAGSSLTEILLTAGLSSILFLMVGSFSLYVGRSFAGLANYADLDNASRRALDRMTKEIRQAISLTSYSATELVFDDADATPLRYIYSPSARTLTRHKNGNNEVLLRECDYLNFSIYQRNPVGGSYDQYPAASPTTCKLINMSWVCSRSILGSLMNTESVQTAKIVIRKQ